MQMSSVEGKKVVVVGGSSGIGLASAKFGGRGGGAQAEYVSGPPLQFAPLRDKYWHHRGGHA